MSDIELYSIKEEIERIVGLKNGWDKFRWDKIKKFGYEFPDGSVSIPADDKNYEGSTIGIDVYPIIDVNTLNPTIYLVYYERSNGTTHRKLKVNDKKRLLVQKNVLKVLKESV